MSKRRIGVNKIKKIIQLSESNCLSMRQISKSLELSRPKIAEVIQLAEEKTITFDSIKSLPDDDFEKLIFGKTEKEATKKSIAIDQFPRISKDLKKPGVTIKLLWEEYLERHPYGLKLSQFCYHFKEWREKSEVSMHIEYKVGDKLLTDYAGKKPTIITGLNGETREVELFISILPATHMIYAEVSESQKCHDWLRSNRAALEFYGGSPKALVSDNLKSAVIKADKYEPDINPQFSMFGEHYNTAILPTRAMAPKDKALVEGAVKIVYQQIIARLRNQQFYSIDELNNAIRPLLERLNNKKMAVYGKSRRELFNELEKSVLQKLPATPYKVREFERTRVQFNYHIRLKADSHYYSVPFKLKKMQVNVYYDDKTVEIVYKNQRVALHRRRRDAGKYTTNKNHMPSTHRFVAEWNPQRIAEWAMEIGKNTHDFVTRLMATKKHPEQGFKSALGVIGLKRKYSFEAIERACNRALYYEAFSYKTVKRILEKKIDNEKEYEDEQINFDLGTHENIRGDYYE